MNTEADLLNSLEDAQGRNPIEFPFGFFLEDNCDDSAGGSFFWYKTDKELQHAIRNDLIDALSNGTSDDITVVKAEISNCIGNSTTDDLLNNFNVLLGGLEVQLQFLGSFEDLCKGKSEWSKYFREEFREEYIEDIEDLTAKKLQSSIKQFEQDDFAEFVSDYVI
ncbi:MAG: hypothetical protein J0649_06805 [Methylococcales bacterium]|jgi:hypothetical protein|nr:hypothetical protein [Methylococcales bacterium]